MKPTESASNQASTVSSGATTQESRPFSARLDRSLFLIVAIMLLFTVALLTVNLVFQHRNYSAGLSTALRSESIEHAVVITYTRAWDFAVVKVSSIFLAFSLIMIGALYVLRAGSVSYSLTVANQSHRSSLETGSPGLVMITLGVVLMAVVLLSTSRVEYQGPSVRPIPHDSQPIPPDVATSDEPEPKARETIKPGDR